MWGVEWEGFKSSKMLSATVLQHPCCRQKANRYLDLVFFFVFLLLILQPRVILRTVFVSALICSIARFPSLDEYFWLAYCMLWLTRPYDNLFNTKCNNLIWFGAENGKKIALQNSTSYWSSLIFSSQWSAPLSPVSSGRAGLFLSEAR